MGADQRVDELQADVVGAEDVGGEPNVRFGALDGGEHLRITLIAAFENRDDLAGRHPWPVIFPMAVFSRSIGSSEDMRPWREDRRSDRIPSADARGAAPG